MSQFQQAKISHYSFILIWMRMKILYILFCVFIIIHIDICELSKCSISIFMPLNSSFFLFSFKERENFNCIKEKKHTHTLRNEYRNVDSILTLFRNNKSVNRRQSNWFRSATCFTKHTYSHFFEDLRCNVDLDGSR